MVSSMQVFQYMKIIYTIYIIMIYAHVEANRLHLLYIKSYMTPVEHLFIQHQSLHWSSVPEFSFSIDTLDTTLIGSTSTLNIKCLDHFLERAS